MFSVFFQILLLVRMGQIQQFCLGMVRHEFQTIFVKDCFYLKSMLRENKGWVIWYKHELEHFF